MKQKSEILQKSSTADTTEPVKGKEDLPENAAVNLIRLYEFDDLDDVIAAARGLNGYFTGSNTLYKDPSDDIYKLVIHQSSCS